MPAPVDRPLAALRGGAVRAAVLTVSDRAAAGTYEDLSGPALASRLEGAGAQVAARGVVGDDRDAIASALLGMCGRDNVDLLLTTGGTGFAARDVTPEATKDVLEREAPGIAELIRSAARARTPFAALSRGVSGLRGRTIIVNLPGSPAGAVEGLEAILEIIPHAVSLVRGEPGLHPEPPGGART